MVTKRTDNVATAVTGRIAPGAVVGALGGILRLPEFSITTVALVIVLIFQVKNAGFLTSLIPVLASSTALYGMMAIGEAMLMITGEIDLSIAKVYSTTPFVAYYLFQAHVPYWLAVILALAAGALIGMINGIITVRFGVPSLIATIGMLFLLNGLTLTISHSEPVVTPTQDQANAWLGNWLGAGGQQLNGGIAQYAGFLWMALFAIVLTVVLRRTRFGMHTIAVGSNLLAAREIGIRTERVKIANFMIMGFLASLNGIIQAVSSGSTDPSAGDNTLALYAIAAAVIGGTSLFGGSGTAIGSVIGAFVLAALLNGLPLIGAQATESDIILGIAIVGAIILNIVLNNLRTRRRT